MSTALPNAFFRCRACGRELFIMPGWPNQCRWCHSTELEPSTPEKALPGGTASFLTKFPEVLSDQYRETLRSQSTPRQRFGSTYLFEMLLQSAEAQAAGGQISKADLDNARATFRQLTERFARGAPTALVQFAALMQKNFADEAALKTVEELHPGASEQLRPVIPYLAKNEHDKIFSPPEDLALSPEQMREDLLDFSAFVEELNAEKDRGAALVGAALVDDRLRKLLRSHLIKGSTLDELLESPSPVLSSFESRTKMCYVLGLVTKGERGECQSIAEIRNLFAHKTHGLKFETPDVAEKCKRLKGFIVAESTPREQYINSVIALCVVLWYRPKHAEALQAVRRDWPWRLTD
jgi:mannitol operon repressor